MYTGENGTYEALEEGLGLDLADLFGSALADRVGLDEIGKEGETQADVEMADDQGSAYKRKYLISLHENIRKNGLDIPRISRRSRSTSRPTQTSTRPRGTCA